MPRRGLGGSGVSTQQLANGTFRIRWRETVVEPDGSSHRVQRSLVVADQATATVTAAKVLRAVESGELYEREAVRRIPVVATVDDVFSGYVRSRAARGAAPNTIEGYLTCFKRALSSLRATHGIAEAVPVPGSLLTRDEVIALANRLRGAPRQRVAGGLGEGTVYATVRVVLAAWVWAGDDPVTYPGIAAPPRDPSSVLPMRSLPQAGPAPTMDECDAVIRILRAHPKAGNVALPVAVIARCTGLRLSQIMALTVGDIHLPECSLHVRTGKSRREKAGRVVPMAPVLRDWLAGHVAGQDPESTVIRRRSDHGVPRKRPATTARGGPDRTLRQAWQIATATGKVRGEVWRPPGRDQGRPDHAFRAAFQAHLVTAGVRDEVIDVLVGHAGGLRARHYVEDTSSRWSALVAAVAEIPELPEELFDRTAAEPGKVIPIR